MTMNYGGGMSMGKIRSLGGIIYNSLFFDLYNHKDPRLELQHNAYKGQRCFIIGSGPSINKTDLSLLKNEITVGLNLSYDKIKTDMHFVIGWRIPMFKPEIYNIPNLYLGGSAARWYLKHKTEITEMLQKKNISKPHLVKEAGELYVWNKFHRNILKGVHGGQTVTAFALQVLLYLGFSEIYLLGHDCDYNTHGQYFYNDNKSGYDRNWEIIFKSYDVIDKQSREWNQRIYNCTIGGNLEAFERKKLEDII